MRHTTGVLFVLCLAGCQPAEDSASPSKSEVTPAVIATPPAPPTSPRICQVEDPKQIEAQCTPGETLIFLPPRFGNEQYPLIAAAIGCDLTKQVIFNIGGVVCTVKYPEVPPPPAPAPAKPASDAANPQP